ncbi:MAG: hypothetical protein EPO24_04695 [Bacteroidetes bacterium]|nr:MAG: hypothetical protein EPO24_04695 [Bacteroidota bacterium]
MEFTRNSKWQYVVGFSQRHAIVSKLVLNLFLVIVPLPTQYLMFAQAQDSLTTNADLFRNGIMSLVDSTIKVSSVHAGASLVTTVSFSEEQPLIEQALVSSLSRNGMVVHSDSLKANPEFSFKVTGAELNVTYSETFRETFFGETKTRRTVSVTLPIVVTEMSAGTVLFGETLKWTVSDTVSTAQISMLEHEQVPSTRAPLPERGFFDRLAEPLIIIGATGVAIYLFFHVRS